MIPGVAVPGTIVPVAVARKADARRRGHGLLRGPCRCGLPGVRIAYDLTEREEAELDTARSVAIRTAALLGDFLPGMPRVMPTGSSLHYMGTFRMGAVDDEVGPRDAGGFVGGEEDGGVDDVVGASDAAERDVAGDGAHRVVVGEEIGAGAGGVDQAGADAVGADAVRGALGGELAGQRDDGALGGGVRGPLAGE